MTHWIRGLVGPPLARLWYDSWHEFVIITWLRVIWIVGCCGHDYDLAWDTNSNIEMIFLTRSMWAVTVTAVMKHEFVTSRFKFVGRHDYNVILNKNSMTRWVRGNILLTRNIWMTRWVRGPPQRCDVRRSPWCSYDCDALSSWASTTITIM